MATCSSHEGCGGRGWTTALSEDDGACVTTYCDCDAGRELVAEAMWALTEEAYRDQRARRTDRFEELYGRTDGAA